LGSTESQRQNIDEACRAVEIRPAAFVSLVEDNGQPLVRFTDAGDVIIPKGTILTEQNLAAKPNAPECDFNDGQGNTVAKVDSATGNLLLAGKLYENNSRLAAYPENAMILKDGNDKIVSFINSEEFCDPFVESTIPWRVPAGSLVLLGHAVYLGF